MKTENRKTQLSLPKHRPDKKKRLNTLLAIMAKLRSPSGCPWDREQTEHTLKKHLIEESYEVLEAIEAGTPEELEEELGDLLLQILFLSRIAEEKGQFDLFEVAHTLSQKLIRRHPHVFPPSRRKADRIHVQSAQDVVQVWGDVKEREGKNAGKRSLLDGIPIALPALERARKISERVSRAGFDWPDIDGVWKKIQEELSELKKALHGPSSQAVEEELGDLLFSLVNWARFKGISAEEALRQTNRRFARRFRQVERGLRRRGRTLPQSTLDEMDHLWNEAKEKEKRGKGKITTKKNPGAGRPKSE